MRRRAAHQHQQGAPRVTRFCGDEGTRTRTFANSLSAGSKVRTIWRRSARCGSFFRRGDPVIWSMNTATEADAGIGAPGHQGLRGGSLTPWKPEICGLRFARECWSPRSSRLIINAPSSVAIIVFAMRPAAQSLRESPRSSPRLPRCRRAAPFQSLMPWSASSRSVGFPSSASIAVFIKGHPPGNRRPPLHKQLHHTAELLHRARDLRQMVVPHLPTRPAHASA